MNRARIVGIAALCFLFTAACGSGTPSNDTAGGQDTARDTGGGGDTGLPDTSTGDVQRPDTAGNDTAQVDMPADADTDGVTTDGGPDGPPPDGPPPDGNTQCQTADVTGAPEVPIVNGDVVPAGKG